MPDRDVVRPQPTEDVTPAAATADAPSATTFSGAGPLPAVGADPTTTTAPSASERAFGGGLLHDIGHGLEDAGKEIEVGAAEAVGVAELGGLRYPVKPYEAQVDGGLYRGSRVDLAGMQALKQMGVVGIVNLCLENNEDAAPAAQVGLKALHVGILDNSAPSIAQMQQFIAFATANPPTYVHCEAGKGRTGTACACYRIAVDGWTADQAIAEAQSFGLSLVNQIAFIRQFAAVQSGASTATTAPTDDDAKPAAAPATTAEPAAPATERLPPAVD